LVLDDDLAPVFGSVRGLEIMDSRLNPKRLLPLSDHGDRRARGVGW
jgi:hypothetical protein